MNQAQAKNNAGHKNLVILDDNRTVRNSLAALAILNGQKKENIFTAGSLGEFRSLVEKGGNEFIRNSNFLLDVNLPDGKSSKLVKEFNLQGNFALFTAMGEDDFAQFKSILEVLPAYRGRVFHKSDPYGVLIKFGMQTKGKEELEAAKSALMEGGVAIHSPPHFAILDIVPNLIEMLKHMSGLGKPTVKANILLNRCWTKGDELMNSLRRAFTYKPGASESLKGMKIEFELNGSDFISPDINIALCFKSEITGFAAAYARVAAGAVHNESRALSPQIKEITDSYL